MKKGTVKAFFCVLLAFCMLFPAFSLSAAALPYDPEIETHAEALLLLNLDTDTILYEKNADERLEPASITKIMTYIVAFEAIDDVQNTMITIPQAVDDALTGTGSSMSGIIIGEELSAYELFNLMMVPSGNDAALALALYVGEGSEAKFVEKMNKKAQELGCKNTHFKNPHGLHDNDHYTSARDLMIITKYALSLPYFAQISNQLYYTLRPTNKCDYERDVYTTNRMLNQNIDDGAYYYRYAQGIKTGSHDEAGYCLVSTAIRDGYSYLCVALGSPSVDADGNDIYTHGEMLDSRALYQWAFENFELKKIVKAGDIKGEIKIDYSWGKDSMLLYVEKSFSALLPYNVETTSILYRYDLPESVPAPINAGDVIGTVTLVYADQELTTLNLLATESAEKSELLYTFDAGKELIFKNWLTTLLFFVGVLLLIYILLVIIYNHKKKKLRRTKRYRSLDEGRKKS